MLYYNEHTKQALVNLVNNENLVYSVCFTCIDFHFVYFLSWSVNYKCKMYPYFIV